ncbi:MAG: hypothetical protein ACYC61_00610 [Isosphaeraceae bacterium]
MPRGASWIEGGNAATTNISVEDMRESVRRGRPFGSETWTQEIARTLELEPSLRRRGRPQSAPEA